MSFSIPMSGSAAATISQILAQKRKQALDTAAVDPATQNNGGQSEIQNYAPAPQSTTTTAAPAIQDLPPVTQTAAAMPTAPVDTTAIDGPPLAPPLQHAVDPKITRSGDRMPMRSDFDNISRRRSMVEALATGLQAGGIGGGLAGLVTGLVSKGIGRNLAYNHALTQFNQQKATEEQLDRGDPMFQESIQTRAAYDREPLKRYENSKAAEDTLTRQTALKNLDAKNKSAQIDQTAKNAITKLGAEFQNKLFLQNSAAKDKANLEMRQIAAGFSGNPAFEAMDENGKASFLSDRWQEQRQAKLDASAAKESQAEEAALLSQERREHPEKFRAPTREQGLTANYQMRLKLKPVEDEQRANQAAINVWNKKRAAGDITEGEYNDRVAPLNAQKATLDAKWAQEAAIQQSSATPAPGAQHPNVGKTFTKDGKQYIADEIDSDGNITKYHPKP